RTFEARILGARLESARYEKRVHVLMNYLVLILHATAAQDTLLRVRSGPSEENRRETLPAEYHRWLPPHGGKLFSPVLWLGGRRPKALDLRKHASGPP